MKLNLMLSSLLNFYAVLWIILGGIGLSFGIVALVQGKFEFSVLSLTVLIGIGLLRRSYAAWQVALIMSSVFLAFLVFAFLTTATSNTFGTLGAQIAWNETVSTRIPGPILYPLGFCLLAGQIWLLLSKPIRLFFSYKTNENAPTHQALADRIKNDKRSSDFSNGQRKSSLRTSLIVTCPECGTRVLPKTDGTCPSCQAKISR